MLNIGLYLLGVTLLISFQCSVGSTHRLWIVSIFFHFVSATKLQTRQEAFIQAMWNRALSVTAASRREEHCSVSACGTEWGCWASLGPTYPWMVWLTHVFIVVNKNVWFVFYTELPEICIMTWPITEGLIDNVSNSAAWFWELGIHETQAGVLRGKGHSRAVFQFFLKEKAVAHSESLKTCADTASKTSTMLWAHRKRAGWRPSQIKGHIPVAGDEGGGLPSSLQTKKSSWSTEKLINY